MGMRVVVMVISGEKPCGNVELNQIVVILSNVLSWDSSVKQVNEPNIPQRVVVKMVVPLELSA
jgi:hypothetical protein